MWQCIIVFQMLLFSGVTLKTFKTFTVDLEVSLTN